MTVMRSREALAIDLRTYGEDEIASQIERLPVAAYERIQARAHDYVMDCRYATPSGASPLSSWALAKAVVEVVGGRPRDLRRKRRKLKGIYPGY